MPRPHTGSLTIENTHQLTIKSLRQSGMLKRGATIKGKARANGAEMHLQLDWTGAQPVLWLSYFFAGRHQHYSISIEERRSNLGRGAVFYFLCPESGVCTRTLYMAYDYPRFKARQAYRNRIYYPAQLTGGRSRYNARFFQTKAQLESMYQGRQYLTHKGKETRRARRQQLLEERLDYYDMMRWTAGLPPALSRLIF